jgi:hypothetical protein
MPTIDRDEVAARTQYEQALREFGVASGVLHAHVLARTPPTDAELAREERARLDLVDARRALWVHVHPSTEPPR